MALTAVTTVDIVGGTQQITFSQGATQIDQITYSSSGITFGKISAFSLSQSDAILYFNYLNLFSIALSRNFVNTNFAVNLAWPESKFDVASTSAFTPVLTYTQTSLGNSVYATTYLGSTATASFSARSSVTTTLQEFLMTILMMNQYTNQISVTP
jgi:hypothetical protein